jgi:Flp pilus assembly pilin Flp
MMILRRLIADEQGQDLIEYAFLVVFIAIMTLVVLKNTSGAVNSVFQKIIDTVGAV